MTSILIVEDVEMNHELLRQLLEHDFLTEPIDETLSFDKIASYLGN